MKLNTEIIWVIVIIYFMYSFIKKRNGRILSDSKTQKQKAIQKSNPVERSFVILFFVFGSLYILAVAFLN